MRPTREHQGGLSPLARVFVTGRQAGGVLWPRRGWVKTRENWSEAAMGCGVQGGEVSEESAGA